MSFFDLKQGWLEKYYLKAGEIKQRADLPCDLRFLTPMDHIIHMITILPFTVWSSKKGKKPPVYKCFTFDIVTGF